MIMIIYDLLQLMDILKYLICVIKIFKVINTNNCYLYHIIQWNNKYTIVADRNNKFFKIINLKMK